MSSAAVSLIAAPSFSWPLLSVDFHRQFTKIGPLAPLDSPAMPLLEFCLAGRPPGGSIIVDRADQLFQDGANDLAVFKATGPIGFDDISDALKEYTARLRLALGSFEIPKFPDDREWALKLVLE